MQCLRRRNRVEHLATVVRFVWQWDIQSIDGEFLPRMRCREGSCAESDSLSVVREWILQQRSGRILLGLSRRDGAQH